MNTSKIYNILKNTTIALRKGDIIVQTNEVTSIYRMPHVSEYMGKVEMVDVHFFVVGVFLEQAKNYRDELIELLTESNLFNGEVSYLQIGAELGSQEAAFLLFGLGDVLGIWKLLTPERMGFEGQWADQFAGMGLITVSRFTK